MALLPLGRWRYLLALLLLPLYLLLAGPSPSLVRASLMAGLSLLGLFLGLGGAGVLQGLGLALFLQVLLRPEAVLSLGFQLSHLAVLGLALVLPALRLPPGPKGYLLGGLAASLAAQAFLVPLLLHRFGFLPLLTPLTNLLALPLVALLVPLGFLKLLLGGLLAPLVEPLAQGLLALAAWAAQGPPSAWEISPWLRPLRPGALPSPPLPPPPASLEKGPPPRFFPPFWPASSPPGPNPWTSSSWTWATGTPSSPGWAGRRSWWTGAGRKRGRRWCGP